MVVVHTQLVEREWMIDGEWRFDWMSSCGGCTYTTGRREWMIDGEWRFDWMSSYGGCTYTTGREGVNDRWRVEV